MTAEILPVPHLYQQEYGECLPACAAMVLAYIGFHIPYKQIRTTLQVRSHIGVPASNIRKLEQIKADVLYQQGTLAKLYEHLTNGQPCLAFVNTSELPYWDEECNHVVVVGLDDKFIYLNDPAFPNAPIEVTHGDFDLAWLERDEFYAVITRKL